MIRIDAAKCVRGQSPAAACRACADVCPIEAIQISKGSAAPTADCDGCGVCAARCPTDAIAAVATASPWKAKGRWFGPKTTSAVCDAASDAPCGPTVACLASLRPAEVVAKALSDGAMTLYRGDCGACLRSASARVVDEIIATSLALAHAVGLPLEVITVHASAEARRFRPDTRARADASALARRALFDSVRIAVERAGEEPDELNKPLPPSRKQLLRLLANRPATQLGAASRLWSRFEPPPGCDACGLCVKLCPTAALALRDRGPLRLLTMQPSRCVGCALCRDVCRPPGAALSWAGPDATELSDASLAPTLCCLRQRSCTDCGGELFFRTDVPDGPRRCFLCEARQSRREQQGAVLPLRG